jgi:hypothetical protein
VVTQLDHYAIDYATRNNLRKIVRRSVMKEIGSWSVAYQRGALQLCLWCDVEVVCEHKIYIL